MTIFGKESGEPFDEIRKIINTIFYSANRLGQQYWKDQGSGAFNIDDESFKRHIKEMHENEAIIWGHYDHEDKIADQIDNCVFRIENYCSTIISE